MSPKQRVKRLEYQARPAEQASIVVIYGDDRPPDWWHPPAGQQVTFYMADNGRGDLQPGSGVKVYKRIDPPDA